MAAISLTVYAKYDYYYSLLTQTNNQYSLLDQPSLSQKRITVLTDPLLGMVAGDVIPDGLLLPESSGQRQAGLLLPLQQFEPLLPVVRLRYRAGSRVCLLVDLSKDPRSAPGVGGPSGRGAVSGRNTCP